MGEMNKADNFDLFFLKRETLEKKPKHTDNVLGEKSVGEKKITMQ